MIKKILLALLIFFGLTPFVFSIQAASLTFDKSSSTASNGGTFQVGVVMNPGSDSIYSTDVYVVYDSSLLKATGVTAGSLFPTVTNDIATSGRVYIAGLVNDTGSPVTASGTVATITFQGLKDGSGNLSFDCNTSKVIKNDLNATNVIVCSQNGTSAVTIGAGGSSSSPTTAPASDTGAAETPSELPQTGIWENVVKFALPGMILLILGSALRFIL
jgi:hypothetical protein